LFDNNCSPIGVNVLYALFIDIKLNEVDPFHWVNCSANGTILAKFIQPFLDAIRTEDMLAR
jgi:hypothetical protein